MRDPLGSRASMKQLATRFSNSILVIRLAQQQHTPSVLVCAPSIALLPVAKNALQTGTRSGYTLSWKRPPPLSIHYVFDNAVMPEKAAFF